MKISSKYRESIGVNPQCDGAVESTMVEDYCAGDVSVINEDDGSVLAEEDVSDVSAVDDL